MGHSRRCCDLSVRVIVLAKVAVQGLYERHSAFSALKNRAGGRP